MWRPFQYTRQASDVEGLEKAEAAVAMAKQIELHATVSERQHREILRRNNLGPKIHKALGGH